jgi:DNA polymerase-3 subunit delta'
LIGTSEHRQLPTIRSRCQIVRFAPLAPAEMAELLAAREWAAEHAELEGIVIRSGGSLERAAALCDPDLREPCQAMLQHLAQPDFDSVALAKLVTHFVEAAGKDAPPRRARLRQMVLEAGDFYRSLLRRTVGASSADDATTDILLTAALPYWRGRAELAARCLERCLAAVGEIEANANVATLINTWIDDLATCSLSHPA